MTLLKHKSSSPLTIEGPVRFSSPLRLLRYERLGRMVSSLVEMKRGLESIAEEPPSAAPARLTALQSRVHDAFRQARGPGPLQEDEAKFIASVDTVFSDLRRKNLLVQRYQAQPQVLAERLQAENIRMHAAKHLSFRAFSVVIGLCKRSYRRAAGPGSIGLYLAQTPFVLIKIPPGDDPKAFSQIRRHEEIHLVLDTFDKALQGSLFNRFSRFIRRSERDILSKGTGVLPRTVRWLGVTARKVVDSEHAELAAEIPNRPKAQILDRCYVIPPADFDDCYNSHLGYLGNGSLLPDEKIRRDIRQEALRLHNVLGKAFLTARTLGGSATDEVEVLSVLLPPTRYSQIFGWLKYRYGRQTVREIWRGLPVLNEKLTDLASVRAAAAVGARLLEDDRQRLNAAFSVLASASKVDPNHLGIGSLGDLMKYRKWLRQIPIDLGLAKRVRRRLTVDYLLGFRRTTCDV